jgi:hypothetical protein
VYTEGLLDYFFQGKRGEEVAARNFAKVAFASFEGIFYGSP